MSVTARFAPFTKGRPSKRGVTVHVGNVVVTIEQGDILSKRCDAVVIATTKDLDLSKGVCGPSLFLYLCFFLVCDDTIITVIVLF